MPSINLQCEFPIRRRELREFREAGPIHPHEDAVFFVRSKQFEVNASVKLVPERQAFWVILPEVAVSVELLDWISRDSSHNTGQYPDGISGEVDALRREASAIARRVADGFKFFLGRASIDDETLGPWQNVLWNQAGTVTQSFPMPPTGQLYMTSVIGLDGFARGQLQEALDKGYEPLLGERHLFRAYQETVPRFRWIDATIAAELAIKEALVRKCPLLNNEIMVSRVDNWTRLYKGKMKQVFGEESPYYPAIKKGATKRNKLIHSTRSVALSEGEAMEYLHQVALAIRNLYKLLYPEWQFTESLPDIIRP